MSTIHDALKKVQFNINRLDARNKPVSSKITKSPFPSGRDNKETNAAPKQQPARTAVIYIIVALLLLLASVLIVPKALNLTRPPDESTTRNTANDEIVTLAPEEIHITGIMTMNNKNVALINGKIYEEGDNVEGETIVRISLDKIEVSGKSGTRTINVE